MLTNSINEMVLRIERVNQEYTKAQLDYLQEKIVFLQAQINPHFLYNNLECIRGMVISGNEKAIREMVSCIAKLYRYCLKGEHLVTLEEEIDSLYSYSRIIYLRYGDRFKWHFNISKDILQEKLPRMILQPIAENAILHGFIEANCDTGTIWVDVRKDEDFLVIQIKDDGTGASEDLLDAMNNDNIDGNYKKIGIGISNLKKRIQLLCDTSSCLYFERNVCGGLTATMKLKVKNKEF